VTLTAGLGWLSLPAVLWRLRRALRGTSLVDGAWPALACAWLAWGAAGIATLLSNLTAGTIDLLWYSVSVVMLVPPIAVLGARRPIHRVWPWFVLLPLLLVFAWPVLSAFGRGRLPVTWNIEEPMVVGYALVLVMGAGNYIGLRYTLPAVLWMAALMLLIGPLCPATAASLPAASTGRVTATALLALAAWLGIILAKTRKNAPPPVHGGIGGGRNHKSALASSPFDQIWLYFRDTFGIVWARRVQERFNDGMRQQGAKIRLGIHGLEIPSDGSPLTAGELQTAETSLRWLLQKFVDPEWIDARMPPN
jgi:hypothetical protein